MSVYRRALRYFRPFLPETLLGTALTLAGIGLNLLKPWPFKVIVDEVLTPGNPHPVTSGAGPLGSGRWRRRRWSSGSALASWPQTSSPAC